MVGDVTNLSNEPQDLMSSWLRNVNNSKYKEPSFRFKEFKIEDTTGLEKLFNTFNKLLDVRYISFIDDNSVERFQVFTENVSDILFCFCLLLLK